jgi:single-strand DNA-binding protein
MNKAILMGRLARDPEIRSTQSGISVCNFTVACDRRTKDERGDWKNEADFIPCIAWRQQGEFVNRYFSKGDRILVSGRIQPRSWDDKNGEKRYATEVIVEEVEFCESPKNKDNGRNNKQEGFVSDDGCNLPFDF